MTRSAGRVANVAAGVLALAMAAACGSSGSGSVVGQPPASSAAPTASTSPTEAPTAPPTSSAPSVNPLRTFTSDALQLTVPVGYVIATTPAQAASRFPTVLGTDAEARKKITDAETRLRSNTIMIAFHAPIGGLSDNIGMLKVAGAAPSDPTEIQGSLFQSQARSSLTKVGARDISFSDTRIGGRPAEQVTYSITSSGGSPVFGVQFYVAAGSDVYIMTATAGSATRAQDAADEIAGSWTFA